MTNWLDKYEYGGQAGYTDIPFKYNSAWGGQFAMGGSLPGSVGFTYARTGGIPSNGPYAKKTKASAENGMTYYQHGLDWKPKTISKNGGWLDKYEVPKNQNAKYQLPSFTMPRAASESTATMFFDPVTKRMVSIATTGQKKEDVAASSKAMGKARKFEKEEEKKRVAERKSAVAAKDKGEAFTLPSGETKKYEDMDAREKMYVSGKALEQRGRFNEDEESFLDEYLNPLNLIGTMAGGLGTAPYEAQQSDSYMPYVGAVAAPLVAGALGFDPLGGAMKVPGKVAQSMESGLLSNTYKLNPFAEKLANANKSYRVAGMDAARDFEATGVLRSNPTIVPANLSEGILGTRTTPFPSFQKGYADLRYLPEEGGVIFETDLPTFRRGEINPVTGNQIRGSHYAHRAIDPTTGKVLTEIPGENVRMFEGKPNWLRGFKEVPKPTSVSSSVESVKPNFKSEIDWGKWNPETPNYPELINEYNAIEESTKKAGTWMKNPDGSTFQGTPEQFIQQQSSYFKKAFGDSKLVNPDGSPAFQYHGGKKGYEQFLTPQDKGYIKRDSYTGDQGIYFTPSKSRGKSYARNTPKDNRELYQTYINIENPYTGKIKGTFGKDQITNEQYEELLKNKYDGIIDKNLFPYHRQTIVFDPKRIKSAVGNVGFFDMTNPNIYKGLVPAGIVGAAALEQKKKGGIIKDNRGQWAHPGEITEIDSNEITMQGVPYPVLGISDEGDTKMMFPEQEYKFKGKKVTEYPLKKSTGGWLDKY